MRERIRKSLLEEVGKTSGELRAHFEEQLRHLDGAPITTIDGFCSQILRDHPVEAGMDPQFTVKEEYEVKEFQASVIDAFLRDLLKKKMRIWSFYWAFITRGGLAACFMVFLKSCRTSWLWGIFLPLMWYVKRSGKKQRSGGRNLPCHARLWGRPKTFKDERRPLGA